MDWKLFWNVTRIALGAVILIVAVVMLCFSLFASAGIDIAYCLFAFMCLVLGLIMVIFGVSVLPRKE